MSVDQDRQVVHSLAQRRDLDGHLRHTKIEVFSKCAAVDGVAKIHVRREQRAHVHLAAAACSYGPNLLVFEHAQQLRLHRRAHFADFVEQQRTAIGLDEDAVGGTIRSRERASDVTEQLAFQQGIGRSPRS